MANLDQLSTVLAEEEEKRKALEEAQGGYDLTGALAGGLASLGAAFQGKDSIAAANQVHDRRAQARKDEVSALDKWKAGKIAEIQAKRDFAKADADEAKRLASEDANSADSLSYQEQVGSLFPRLAGTIKGKSKAQVEAMMPLLTAKIRGDQDRENALIAAGSKKAQQSMLDDKQVSAITDLDNAESDLKNLLGQLGDKSDWTGPADGRIPDLLIGDDQVAWRSALGKYKDAYRKAVTGAGAGPSEIARLETRLPSETDTHANFGAKAKEALAEIARRKQTLLGNYGKMGKDVSQYGSPRQATGKTIVKTQTNQKTGERRVVYSDGTTEIVGKSVAGK